MKFSWLKWLPVIVLAVVFLGSVMKLNSHKKPALGGLEPTAEVLMVHGPPPPKVKDFDNPVGRRNTSVSLPEVDPTEKELNKLGLSLVGGSAMNLSGLSSDTLTTTTRPAS